ncbi:MAG TPA: methyltransferase domain-containing protein [Polyangia bacterium]|nr:methyltransferase domain-containing protein [Polyangia bacterium]
MVRQVLKSMVNQSLRVDGLRHYLTYARFLYFTKVKKSLQSLDESPGVAERTVAHNVMMLKTGVDIGISRSRFLVWPLSVIETLGPDSKILVIGPRSEGELFHLMGFGFRRQNIQGLDLTTYSPWIQLGDMHAIPHNDSQWDAVIMGWVLAYSTTPAKAAAEAIRVTKNGGIIAVGIEYNPMTNEEIANRDGYFAGGIERIESVAQVLSFFGDHVDRVYFSHDVHPNRRHMLGAIAVVFSIKK